MNPLTDQLNKVEIVKPELGHRKSQIVGFSRQQNAECRMLEIQ